MKSVEEIGKELQKNWLSYLVFFVLIPLLQILIFLYVPTQTKQSYFTLNQNVTVTGLFLENYTHLALPHITGNLGLYIILIVLIFILNYKIKSNKKRFYIDMAAIFLIAPCIISLTSLYVFKYLLHKTIFDICGFSGIDAALVGYFTYLFIKYLNKLTNNSINQYRFLSGILCINLGLVAQSYNKQLLSIFAILFGFLLLLINRGWIKKLLQTLFVSLREATPSKLIFDVIFYPISISTLFSLLPSLMTIEYVANVGLSNVFAHYSGYGFGILLGYICIWFESRAK